MALASKLVIVTRKTALDELVIRFGTRDRARFYIERSGGNFSDYEQSHLAYSHAQAALRAEIPMGVRTQWIDRGFLPTFVFGPNDLVITLGQDGLVVNTAKYLDGQPLIAINPDPARIDGVLLPFTVLNARLGIEQAIAGDLTCDDVTMAEVLLNDGQRLLAVNDLFIGPKSHGSARYKITHADRAEVQSSSGVIVSTGAGSTGWFRSILAGAAGVAEGFDPELRLKVKVLRKKYRHPWDSPQLVFCVREPFASRTSAASVVFGWIKSNQELVIESLMPSGGIIFSDGVEEDALQFNSGSVARIKVARRVLKLAKKEVSRRLWRMSKGQGKR